MSIRVFILLLAAALCSCGSVHKGVDPLGSEVAVYRNGKGEVVKHIRRTDDPEVGVITTVVVYAKR